MTNCRMKGGDMLLKRWRYVLIGLIATAAIAGCSRSYYMATPFNESEFIPYLGYGTSTIQGQAFLKTRGGQVRYAAGNTITLIPVTQYSREVWNASSYGRVTNIDERWYIYVRKATADGFGNFEFKNIPAGEYYIECSIFWEVPGRYGLERTGTVVKKQTKVRPNQTVKLVLTE